MKKSTLVLLFVLIFSLPAYSVIRVVAIDKIAGKAWIKNFHNATYNYHDFELSINANYFTLNSLSHNGDLVNWSAGVTYEFSGLSFPNNLTAGASVSIWYPNSLPSNAVSFNLVDFLQYGSAGHTYESVADNAGKWTTGDYITAPFPLLFTGTIFDYGSAFYTTGTVNIPELEQAISIQVFPNPSEVSSTIKWSPDFGGGNPVTLRIYDANGKLVFQKSVENSELVFNTGELSDGQYAIELVNSENEKLTQRVVRQ